MAEQLVLHQSHLNKFELCGEAYRRHYVENDPMPPGIAAHRGTGVHAGAQANHHHKKAQGSDLKRKDIVDISVAAYDDRREKEGVILTPEEMSAGASTTFARHREVVVTLAGLYSDQVAPRMKPDLIEVKIKVSLNDKVALEGTLDLGTVDRRVKDFKTSTRAKSQSDCDNSNQFSQYGILYHAKTGHWPSGFDMENLVATKVPKVVQLHTTRTQTDYMVLANRANVMIRSRDAGLFAPAAVGAWNCSQKWCAYWPTCPYVNSERRAAALAAE